MTSYELFSGNLNEPLWLESIEGEEAAYERMEKRARENPGAYFLFSAATSTVIASLDTSASGAEPPRPGNAAKAAADRRA